MDDKIKGMGQDKFCAFEFMQKKQKRHSHNFFELVYVKEGEMYHLLEGKKYKVSKGNYFIINIDDLHGYDEVSKQGCKIVNCLFYPEFIDITMKHCKSFSQLIESYLIKFNQSILTFNPTLHLFYDEDNGIEKLIDKMIEECQNKKHGYTELARCYLIEILIDTMRKITDNEKAVKKNSPIKFIEEYVEKNYNTDIRLSDLSRELNYSLSYISTKFKKDTGFLFSDYLQKYRINQSCRLLCETDKKITEIAELVGYEDVKFFGEVFKKYMNVTPREYRKNNR